MRVECLQWSKAHGWPAVQSLPDASAVIYFAGKHALDTDSCYSDLRGFYPNAQIIGCSTGGEIFGSGVFDDTVAAAALRCDHTSLKSAAVAVANADESFAKGAELAAQLQGDDLRYVLLLSDGTNVNGSALIEGIYSVLPRRVIITGGLAGDGANFHSTLVGLNGPAIPKQIAVLGFYGDALKVGYGSVGGWKPFGTPRYITKSRGNVLYELDGKPALQLYKVYLGEDANDLPKNALLYPLNIRPDVTSEHDTVRTIVNINEEDQSLIFAGDVPEGYHVRLMRAEPAQLVEGAGAAAELAKPDATGQQMLTILVSCIGRKLLLGSAVSQETAAVAATLRHQTPIIGFYSYGEICHQQFTHQCSLHNQTMTVTVLREG